MLVRLFDGADFTNEHKLTYWHLYLVYLYSYLVKIVMSSSVLAVYCLSLSFRSREVID